MKKQPVTYTEVARLLDQGLAAAGLSQNKLAVMIGINRGTLTRFRHGQLALPPATLIQRLAAVLHQDPFDYHIANQRDQGQNVPWQYVLRAELGIGSLTPGTKEKIEQLARECSLPRSTPPKPDQ